MKEQADQNRQEFEILCKEEKRALESKLREKASLTTQLSDVVSSKDRLITALKREIDDTRSHFEKRITLLEQELDEAKKEQNPNNGTVLALRKELSSLQASNQFNLSQMKFEYDLELNQLREINNQLI